MRHLLISLLLLVNALPGVRAQDIPQPLTEAAAVQLALQHQPSLNAAQAQAGMALARVSLARSDERLQFSANGLTTISSMNSVLTAPAVMPQALLQSQNRSSADVNGMAMLPLYTGGRIQSSIRSAQFSAAAAQFQVAAARTQVAFAARTRFAQWAQAQAMQTVADDTLTAQKMNAEVSQQLVDAGKVPQFDQLRAQAARAAAEQQVAYARAELTSARAQLAQALGVPVDSLPATTAEGLPAAPPANALDTALRRRPDLLAARQTISAAQASLAARKAEYRPQVYAIGMLDILAPANMGKSAGVTTGVIAGMPILDGGRRVAEIHEAEQAIQQAQAEQSVIELQVRAEITSAEARVMAARQNIDTASSQVTAAVAAYTVAQARYAGGKSVIVELLDAQRARTEAQQNLLTTRSQYRAMLAALYQAMGVE